MPKYIPIEVGVELKASVSDILDFRLHKENFYADFIIPANDRQALRVEFKRDCIVRLLDEMPLSTEDDSLNVGLVSEHFAYVVEDAKFFLQQSMAFKAVGRVRHYRFITGWMCMDLISASQPSFLVVTRDF